MLEGSPSMRHMLRAVLEEAGFQVAVASDGAEAIGLLKSGQFAHLLTDLILPQKDAINVLKTTREPERLGGTVERIKLRVTLGQQHHPDGLHGGMDSCL